jgi:hypothetical protein
LPFPESKLRRKISLTRQVWANRFVQGQCTSRKSPLSNFLAVTSVRSTRFSQFARLSTWGIIWGQDHCK